MAARIALTKDERTTRDELAARVTIASKELADAVSAYNDAVRAAHATLMLTVEAYNDALADVREFTEGTAGRLRDAMADRSEAWLDSPKGAAADRFVETIEGVAAEDFEVDEPEEIEAPEDPADALNEIADEPDNDD
jgi:lipopolysaccharide biosynthesis regulator YciM